MAGPVAAAVVRAVVVVAAPTAIGIATNRPTVVLLIAAMRFPGQPQNNASLPIQMLPSPVSIDHD